MKKNILSLTILFVLLISVSCKKEVKSENNKTSEFSYTLDSKSAKIGWTAYKTTEKLAVKGEFKDLNLKIGKDASNAAELINSTEFNIPVSSIFTNNDDRDSKLKQFFFGAMKNTTALTGKLNINEDKTGTLTVTMNGVSNEVPITYTLENNVFILTGTMDLNNWDGQEAIASINKACFDLHKGADGVSKTWNDVQIDASINLVKK
ncbi:YceI family protein [Urechidicola vernalis]|uniref:YceI family protein n=1 Tax=Urechidicola vernalis TaxID=3075600 RepID=A0ABU2Y2J4_9FLAO|nr:YceI family protein [Urechidicola sp. P050]MDT0552423.1 YceI family protein [Urechidicola sp. P050]